MQFVGFLEQSGQSTVTTEFALAWASQPIGVKTHRWRQRLGMVRGFARYLATFDPATEIPPCDLLPARQQRVAPYIYSPAEIELMMSAAKALSPPVRGATVQTVIGLLAASGMRLGEVLALDDGDVDFDAGVITAVGKWGKQREIVAIAVEVREPRGFGRISLQRVPDVSAASLVPFVCDVVEPGTVVMTDGWASYNPIVDHGYTREKTVVTGPLTYRQMIVTPRPGHRHTPPSGPHPNPTSLALPPPSRPWRAT